MAKHSRKTMMRGRVSRSIAVISPIFPRPKPGSASGNCARSHRLMPRSLTASMQRAFQTKNSGCSPVIANSALNRFVAIMPCISFRSVLLMIKSTMCQVPSDDVAVSPISKCEMRHITKFSHCLESRNSSARISVLSNMSGTKHRRLAETRVTGLFINYVRRSCDRSREQYFP